MAKPARRTLPVPSAAAGAALAPLRLLRVVATVAEHGSASGAALALHQSASAVTRAVQQAEALLGLALFERGARGMVATPAGAVLVERVRRALGELRRWQRPAFAQRATEGMLDTLSALAETRSEGAAAERLGVTQPAVHAALRRLEHAAGARLFQRSRRGTRLTDAGETMLRCARLAAAELRSAHDELSPFRGLSLGRVTVGALPISSDTLVPQALSRLYAAEPGVLVTVLDGTYEALTHALRHGDIDIVVGPLRGARCCADVAEEVLFVDSLLPVVRSGHPLARRRPKTLRALRAWPWIGPLPGSPAHAAFERAFEAEGVPTPPIALQAFSAPIIRSVLMSSDHIAMVSPMQIGAELAAGTLTLLPVPVRGTERAIGIAQRRGGVASPACRALLRELRAVAAAAEHRS